MGTYTSIFGGHIADQPKPIRRLYSKQGRKKRILRLTVMRYSIGKHYWTSLHEDDNPIWDKEIKGWRLCWDDLTGRGRIESRQCNNVVEVRRWVRHMMRMVFKNHKLETDFLEDEVKSLFVYAEHD